jgi:hypothetical protein
MDVLLWASELHGRLRRGPRVPARISILLRSNLSGEPWEEKTETEFLSRHGAQILCRHEVKMGDVLTCVRLDSGVRAESRVVWTRPRPSGEMEVGIEFSSDMNYWNFGSSKSPQPPANHS